MAKRFIVTEEEKRSILSKYQGMINEDEMMGSQGLTRGMLFKDIKDINLDKNTQDKIKKSGSFQVTGGSGVTLNGKEANASMTITMQTTIGCSQKGGQINVQNKSVSFAINCGLQPNDISITSQT